MKGRLLVVLQVDADHAADAPFLHGHAKERVAALHGALSVGHDDELGILAELLQVVGKVADIGVIQRGFDLVQNTEGRRLQLQHGEQDRDGRQGTFTAAEQAQKLSFLSRKQLYGTDGAGGGDSGDAD